ncbi:hypothetical protein B0O99DRAFT_83711 [Bisporella sp. PMI_857]|nr:hypothetical protein B0O99DRAFT_83711 [Bisporella sp. PMI_857]
MPEKPLTVATYAAGASLAAITLVYVFAPTFFIDGDSNGSASSRKRGVVGLSNSANDCFINSVLQALAGLGDLRHYLIRETHRRSLDGPDIYSRLVPDPARKNLSPSKIEGLQAGLVTHGLKDILDSLNERPLYKKTISASTFVSCLENAFKQRISRQQQDAQEFLQVVAERLCDEYHAGHRARKFARQILNNGKSGEALGLDAIESEPEQIILSNGKVQQNVPLPRTDAASCSITDPEGESVPPSFQAGPEDQSKIHEEEGFPLEGGSESQIECMTCKFKPKPTKTTFCSLTLSVPQVGSTTLSSCFDQMFKTEYIDDFKCENCRLVHAMTTLEEELTKSTSNIFKQKTREAIKKLQAKINTDPEGLINEVELPDMRYAPKRRIAKHVRITHFPKVIAIHLSRSIFDASRSTMKNSAKVSFPEKLPLGGLAERRIYRLLSVVCHKGSHHSGHYESFRRQNVYPPFSTPNVFQGSMVYSKPSTPAASQISTPQMYPQQKIDDTVLYNGTVSSTSDLGSPAAASSSSLLSTTSQHSEESFRASGADQCSMATSASSSVSNRSNMTAKAANYNAARNVETSSLRSVARSARESLSSRLSSSRGGRMDDHTVISIGQPSSPYAGPSHASLGEAARSKRKKGPGNNRWWRISDEKIKEAKTSDVLAMQKEVYMLFYELEKDE